MTKKFSVAYRHDKTGGNSGKEKKKKEYWLLTEHDLYRQKSSQVRNQPK